jgi:hypothetical protein
MKMNRTMTKKMMRRVMDLVVSFQSTRNFIQKTYFSNVFFFHLDHRYGEKPIVEAGNHDDLPHSKHHPNGGPTGAASTLRISLASATLVLSSLIVMSFKKF